jgi:BMFP domain-containing protein YqiC|tara:strand:+ start:493 stop:747 length:255 start_codon:yes stop_codon:yes gene_type:complete
MMDNSQKFLKMLSDFIEAGILTSQDLKKELLTSIKFKKESLVNNLDLVTREEFIILKKLIEKQQKEIHNLKKNKLRKFKKGKRS